jgi:hypothetical protein
MLRSPKLNPLFGYVLVDGQFKGEPCTMGPYRSHQAAYGHIWRVESLVKSFEHRWYARGDVVRDAHGQWVIEHAGICATMRYCGEDYER